MLSTRFLARACALALIVACLAGASFTAPGRAAEMPATGAPLVHLPADQFAHSSANNEWWYVVGHLQGPGGAHFGFEITLFKFDHVRPPGFAIPLTIYRTDIALTDVSRHQFHQSVTYYFPQSASLSASQLDERIGSARLQGSSPRVMTVKAALPGGSIALHVSSVRPPMYVGGRGYIPFGNGYTFYYSLTDLKTSGTVTISGRRYAVTGVSWLDHQWGRWSWTTVRGWTWMALQLDNGVQLSVFDFRGTTTRVRAASVLARSGATLTEYGATISPSGSWRSPHTHAVYPARWIVRIPALHAELTDTPSVRDQELVVPNETRASYWEGAGTIRGSWQSTPVVGQSYTELTGFASS